MTPADTAIHELARGVAQATIELVSERYPAMCAFLRLLKHEIAHEIAEATMGAAEDDPSSEVHEIRRLTGAAGVRIGRIDNGSEVGETRCLECGHRYAKWRDRCDSCGGMVSTCMGIIRVGPDGHRGGRAL